MSHFNDPLLDLYERASALARYREIRARLPALAEQPQVNQIRHAAHLAELIDHFDAFVLDGFGVLNVGAELVSGAIEHVSALQDAGKAVMVLTNGATRPSAITADSYRQRGLHFSDEAVVSSRDALAEALQEEPWPGADQDRPWAFMAPEHATVNTLAPQALRLNKDSADPHHPVWNRAGGFVLLSTLDWDPARQRALQRALEQEPRPVRVGNPDLVAPHELRFSIEPGAVAHAIHEQASSICFYGKPFAEVFGLLERRLRRLRPELQRSRIAMVGDTLHTDILGARAAGWSSVLVSGEGLLRGCDVNHEIEAAGIVPDWIVPTT